MVYEQFFYPIVHILWYSVINQESELVKAMLQELLSLAIQMKPVKMIAKWHKTDFPVTKKWGMRTYSWKSNNFSFWQGNFELYVYFIQLKD